MYSAFRAERRASHSRKTLAALCLGVVLSAAPCWADDAPVLQDPSVMLTPRARIAQVRALLMPELRPARIWRWGWLSAYSALTVAQLAPVPFIKDHPTRDGLIVGTIGSAIGVGFLLFKPMTVEHAAAVLEGLPDDFASANEAEQLLRDAADDEALGHSWLIHVGNVGFNLGLGLVLGLGLKRWDSAALSFVTGTIAGEVMIFTRPNHLNSAYTRAIIGPFSFVPTLSPNGAGVSAVGIF